MSKIASFINTLQHTDCLEDQLIHHQFIPGREGTYARASKDWPEQLKGLLSRIGIHSLYSHQAKAIDHIRSGEHVVIATPTASGKSLIYNLPVLERICEDSSSRSLYLFPLKALAQDQLKNFKALTAEGFIDPPPEACIYDGDTPRKTRYQIRTNPPQVLMTNPEMLHLGLLPYHHNWKAFFSKLDFVVVDEVHTYRGVMGSNMSWVFRRLLRICYHYGSKPIFILCSATIGNPGELAEKLTGLRPAIVRQSGSPSGPRHFLFVNPQTGTSPIALRLLQQALPLGLRTIVYSQSRKMTELIALWSASKLKNYRQKISAYRSGFLPSERREIEAKLSRGDLLAVITTSALELGIDIGELDLCILVGYPGSIMASWQRGGRVGRQQQESVIILIAQEDNLDQYFMHHPRIFFQMQPEKAVINPFNSKILFQQLQCAASDLPLKEDEPLFKAEPVSQAAADLEQQGLLLRGEQDSELLPLNPNVQLSVNLRGSGKQMRIVNATSGEFIGSIDFYRAHHETYPGAVYLHRGQTYLITDLLPQEGTVLARQEELEYFTRVKTEKSTEILQRQKSKKLYSAEISFGRLRVRERITGYEQRSVKGQQLLAEHSLDLEPLIFETEGMWLVIPQNVKEQIEAGQMHFMGGIHALEHAMIGMLPLLVLTDRNDLGGISLPVHQQLRRPAVFVYDGIPGGIGLTALAYAAAEELLKKTEQTISACTCELGCPACVHSPKCGSGNRPLDKAAAIAILAGIMSETTPRYPCSPDREHSAVQAPAPKFIQGPPPLTYAAKPRSTPTNEQLSKMPDRFGVLDLETQRSAREVGGWGNAKAMGVSCAILYDSELNDYLVYKHEEIKDLINHLRELNLVVGFNIKGFDYRVLAGYIDFKYQDLPTLDILEKIKQRLGYRVSLDCLAEATLGSQKTANGLQALKWWKQGQLQKIINYCRMDVAITRELYFFGHEHKYLLFKNKAGQKVRLEVNW